MDHHENGRAPSTLLPALNERLGLNTTLAQNNVPFDSIKTAFEDADWHVRVEAVLAASGYPDQIPLEMLLGALQDEDVSVRAVAVRVLGNRKTDIPVAQLVEALHDNEWLVREAAVLTLGELGERMPREQLMVALDDDNVFVQEAAHSVLDAFLAPVAVATQVVPPTSFVTRMLDSTRRRFAFVIQARSGEVSQNTNDFENIDSHVAIVDLEPLESPTPMHPPTILAKTSRLSRLAMGGLAVLVVFAIVASWLILLPRLHSSRSGQNTSTPVRTLGPNLSAPVGTVLFKLPHQANRTAYYLPAWTADNRYLSFVDDQGGVYVWDSTTGQVKKTITLHYQTIDPDPNATWFRLPGGKYIVSTDFVNSGNNTTKTYHQIWNVLTGQTVLSANMQVYWWSNHGTFVALVDNNNDLQIWNADTQTRLLLTSSAQLSNTIDISWSSDDQHIAIASNDGLMQVLDAKTGTVLRSFKIPLQSTQGNINNPSYSDTWSNDLSHVIIFPNDTNAGSNAPAQVWDATTGRKILTFSGDTATAYLQVWFNDGVRVLSQDASKVLVWNTLTGHILLSFPNTISPNSGTPALSLSPDNTLLIYNDGSSAIHVWDTVSGRELFTFRGHKANVIPSSVTWSPDSTYVASVDENGVLLVWNARTGALALKYNFPYIAGNLFPIVLTAWSPNGKMLALTSDQDTVTVLRG